MKTIENLRIAVVGDVMLDHYIYGRVDRISQEAPVPILHVTQKDTYSLGGAGNVVRNLSSIGVDTSFFTLIGDDDAGNRIINELGKINAHLHMGWIDDAVFTTTVKTRLISTEHQSQVLRFDREVTPDYHNLEEEVGLHDLLSFDAIIISDYGKGAINKDVMAEIRSHENDKIFIDPKPNNMPIYGRNFMITPNRYEFNEIWDSYRKYGSNSEWILETRGKDGMALWGMKNNDAAINIYGDPVEVYNVSGAGDTVMASLVVCNSLGHDVLTSVKVANQCGRWAVSQPGTSAIPRQRFEQIVKDVIE